MKIRNIYSIVATILFALTLSSCYISDMVNQKPVPPQIQQPNQTSIPQYGQPNQPLQPSQLPLSQEIPKEIPAPAKKLKVAVMLPLSGKDAPMGQSMLNSINLSLFDNDSKGAIELVLFDNRSSDAASKKAIEEIAAQNIKIVIGPIFTHSVESISAIAAQNNISVISFSNNSDLINQKGIFLAGFSLEQEIDRISSYLINNGNLNFAIITQNDQYGLRMAKTLRQMVEMKDGKFISSQFYVGSQADFVKTAQKAVSSYIMAKNKGDYKGDLEAITDPKERKAKELEILSKHKIYADTILVTEASNKSSGIVKAIRASNRDGRDIKIIATSHWDKDFIIKNPAMDGVMFAQPDTDYYDDFVEKYKKIYQATPNKVDSIAYDVAAFVIDLADEIQDDQSINSAIVNFNDKKGYRGINGLFRFLPNGLVERNLAVVKIEDGKLKQVGKAPTAFMKY